MVARLTDAEAQAFGELLSALMLRRVGDSRIESMLLRSLNFLHDWPSNLDLDAFVDESVTSSGGPWGPRWDETPAAAAEGSACQWPPGFGLSESLCPALGRAHVGDFIWLGVQVAEPRPWLPIFFPLLCPDFERVVAEEDCFGRCGRGCIGDGPPNNDLNIYAQSCFNHDGCAEALGLLDPRCNQMFLYTAVDFFFGSSCD
jgi:hypothetical protein